MKVTYIPTDDFVMLSKHSQVMMLIGWLMLCLANECEARLQYELAVRALPSHKITKELHAHLAEQLPHTSLRVSCLLCHDSLHGYKARKGLGVHLEASLSGIDVESPSDVYPALESALREYLLEIKPEVAQAPGFSEPMFPELTWQRKSVNLVLFLMPFAASGLLIREATTNKPRFQVLATIGMFLMLACVVSVRFGFIGQFPRW